MERCHNPKVRCFHGEGYHDDDGCAAVGCLCTVYVPPSHPDHVRQVEQTVELGGALELVAPSAGL